MPTKSALMFVEDPGAANFGAPLAAAMRRDGWRVSLLAEGSACDYLAAREIPYELPDRTSGPAPGELLLVGTSENPQTRGLELIEAAHNRGVVSIGMVDGFPNAAHRFRGRSNSALQYAPDWLLLPDEATRSEYVALGFSPDRAAVCGHPYLDEVRAMGRCFAKEGKQAFRHAYMGPQALERRLVVFAAEVSTGLNAEQYQRSAAYTLAGRGVSCGRTEIVLEEFLDALAELPDRPFLVLRLHPKNAPEDFQRYDAFEAISHGGSPLDLLYAADLVVGMTSSLIAEAAALGQRTLSIVPRLSEAAWLPTVATGLTPCVTTRHDLRAALWRWWHDPGVWPHASSLDAEHDAAARALQVLSRALGGEG